MAFADFVARVFGKRQVWLYRIQVGSNVFHYTSKASGYTTPNNRPDTDFPTGQVWSASSILRGEIFQSTLANRSDTWLRLPTRNAAITAILNFDSVNSVRVSIWQGYIGDPEDEFVLQFTGRVVSFEADMILTTLICDTALSETSRSSVAQVVQRPCRHAHYFTNADGGGCRLELADFQQSAEATVATGRVVTVPLAGAQPDGTFLAGIFEYDGKEYLIQNHVGNLLTLENEPEGLSDAIALGETLVLIAPGCQLTIQNCDEFDNTANFGGFPEMIESEFDGRSLV